LHYSIASLHVLVSKSCWWFCCTSLMAKRASCWKNSTLLHFYIAKATVFHCFTPNLV
jgi:hypothetical protein